MNLSQKIVLGVAALCFVGASLLATTYAHPFTAFSGGPTTYRYYPSIDFRFLFLMWANIVVVAGVLIFLLRSATSRHGD